MKRILALLLAILLLAGCSSGNNAVPTNPTAPTQTESSTPSAPTEPTLPPIEVDPRFESLEQEAVVKTALAFLNRGKYIQYDDSRFNPSVQVYRWEVGLKGPEDYTSQAIGYTNCAAFTYDVYKAALDYDIGVYTTANLTAKGTSMRRYTYIPTGKETAGEMAAVEADFRANLKIGDIIVVRYNGDREGNGHAMLYVGEEVVGNGKDIIHSTGSSYSYKDFTEKAEASGTVQTLSTDQLFAPSGSMYVFSKIKSLCLIRPLNTYKGGVPVNTQNRILNMENIVAEKLSSHQKGMTVNPGEEISFSFSVSNKNNKPVILAVQDTIPANCTYLAGAEKVEGKTVSWQVTVPAKEKVTVSYTVRVNADAAYGDTVSGSGSVGGVTVNCPKVYVQKSLSAEDRTKLLAAAGEISGQTGMALADAIYEKALGKVTGLPTEFSTLDSTFFSNFSGSYQLKGQGDSLDLIPAGMFGGRKVIHRGLTSDYLRLEYVRTRLPHIGDLMVGDIILAVGGPNTPGQENLYLFLGDKTLNLTTGKTTNSQLLLNMLIAYERFVIIRPSVGM